MHRLIERLKRHPDFRDRWERLQPGDAALLFIDQGAYAIHDAEFGPMRWHAWRTRVALDERFMVVHFAPADDATARALKILTGRDGLGPKCPPTGRAHGSST